METKDYEQIEEGSSLFFEGRAWYDKTNGNTYHSVRIWINGKVMAIVPRRYGYENAYQVSAIETLIQLGLLPETLFQHGADRPTRDYPLWQIDRHLKTVTYSVLTYGKRSELFKEGN
jgi:hypothetical protein